jgi:hypothetical protein
VRAASGLINRGERAGMKFEDAKPAMRRNM